MSRVPGRVARLERRLIAAGQPPARVQLALQRMRAREALFDKMCIEAAEQLEAELAEPEGRRAERHQLSRADAARFREAQRLLSQDDSLLHDEDRTVIFQWERSREGKVGPYERRWSGAWQRRLFDEILDEVEREIELRKV